MTETDQDTQYALGPLGRALAVSELDAMDAWWRAANYLSVGQIYLLSNPLLT
jgi:xylulose-5-phosphate/fructose-6-phosphate phosphoketolase